MNGWTVETGVMHMNNITPSSKKKTSISVREMRQILGLNKVESYWLVHQNRFRTIVAAGRMRIMLDSFEEWYAGRSEEHTSELQSRFDLVCRLLLEPRQARALSVMGL